MIEATIKIDQGDMQFTLPPYEIAKLAQGKPLHAWTEEDIQVADQALKEIQTHNQEVANQMARVQKAMVQIAIAFWGEDSKQAKYLAKQDPPEKRPYFSSSTAQRVRDAKHEVAKKRQEEREDERQAKVLSRAVKYLIDQGMTLGEDFLIVEAVEKAKMLMLQRFGEAGHSTVCRECECREAVYGQETCSCGALRLQWRVQEGDGIFHETANPEDEEFVREFVIPWDAYKVVTED